ncbi:MAG: glycosyltransferase [Bacilli bacterium]|nr:glycosyltransferase [Bacilli bacterium]
MPLISVIVPIYNSEKYLDKCLDSISNQSYKNLEIILINDGSTDSSLDICKKWKKKDKRIVLIDRENKGVSESRNEGLEIAKGDYISFVDSDDYLDKDCFKTLMKNNKDYDIIVFNYYITNHNIKKIGITDDIQNDFLTEIFYNNVKGYLWNKLYKKALLNRVKFDKTITMCEDLLFNYRIACKKNINYYYCNLPLYYYFQNENSAVKKFDSDLTKFYAYIQIIELLNNFKYAEDKKVEFMISYKCFKEKNIYVRNDEQIEKRYKMYIKDILLKKSKVKNKLKILFITLFPKIYMKMKESDFQ